MNARTATLPRRVGIAGQDASAAFWEAVAEIRIRQARSRPTGVEITLTSTPRALPSAGAVGDELELELGDGALRFVGDITTVSRHHDTTGIQVLRIRAFDRLHRLRHHQTVRSFTESEPAAIARQVLAGAALDLDADGTWTRLDLRSQHRENDLAFLAGLLDRIGGHLDVDGTTARLRGYASAGDTVTLTLGSDLTELTTSATSEGVADVVHAMAWDPARAEAVQVSVDAPTAGPDVEIEPGDLGQERWLHDTGSLDVESARAEAQAVLDRSRSSAVRMSGRAIGRPDLRPGVRCEFLDHSGRHLGAHTLAVVDHRLTGAGLVSELSTHPPPAPEGSGGASGTRVVRAVVTAVDDPEGRGRIRLVLPTMGGATSPWLDVVHPGASDERGLIAVPASDDVVLAIFPEGDLARGVVIGGLLGRAGPARGVVDGQRVVRHVWN
ncbi:MAG: phage baseplate assembly protein V, partial [Acidimicrobiales bacterium]